MKLRKFVYNTINEYLDEKYTKSNLDIIKDFYSEYYSDPKNKSEIVGWSSKKEQEIRFKVLLDVGFKNGDTILDFGCGLGALYEYMSKRYDSFNYIGVDVNDDFIKKCEKKFPNVNFKTIKDISDVNYFYDWFIASGAFTVYTPIKNMMETIKIAHKQAKYGMAVNFLESTYAKDSDLEAIRGYDKEELFNTFLQEFDDLNIVKLVDSYIEKDFTIYIKKIDYFLNKK
jgi:cyclopropane fatty-acyl-phospholipid synthase-like methyltransferase